MLRVADGAWMNKTQSICPPPPPPPPPLYLKERLYLFVSRYRVREDGRCGQGCSTPLDAKQQKKEMYSLMKAQLKKMSGWKCLIVYNGTPLWPYSFHAPTCLSASGSIECNHFNGAWLDFFFFVVLRCDIFFYAKKGGKILISYLEQPIKKNCWFNKHFHRRIPAKLFIPTKLSSE